MAIKCIMRAKIKRGIRKNNHEHFYGGFVNESNQQTILWYNSNSRASLSPGGGTRSIGMNRAKMRS